MPPRLPLVGGYQPASEFMGEPTINSFAGAASEVVCEG